ncbi:MAG: MATE family efflux transporter [Tissierellia bacterium]|nr:MATE family efflux transporter [Tissierellia bacterium]
MSKSISQFSTEKVSKLLLKFSIPVILSFLVTELYNMADVFFVGNFESSYAVGGITVIFPIQKLLVALSIMIAIGTSTAVSTSIGQKNIERAKSLMGSGILLILSVVLPLAILVFFFTDQALQLIGVDPALMELANRYLKTVVLGSTFLGMNMYLSNVLLALGDNKTSVLSNTLGASINVLIDYILVVKMGYGIRGAAIATVISQICACTFSTIRFRSVLKEKDYKLKFAYDKALFVTIVTLGISSFVIEAEDGFVMGVLNKLLSSTVGAEGVVILGIITRVYMFLFITLMGISAAMQPIAAYNAGAKDYKRVKNVVKETTIFTTITTIILWAFMLINAETIIGIFIKDRDLILKSVDAFRIMISVFPVISIYYVAIYYFQSMRQARIAIILSLVRQLISLVIISIVLVKVFNLGAMGVWLAYPLSDILSGIIAGILMKKENDNLNKLIKTKEAK